MLIVATHLTSVWCPTPQIRILFSKTSRGKNWGFSRQRTPKTPILAVFGQIQVQISSRVLVVWKWRRYVKYLKIFEVSENFEKKGFSDPEHTQTRKWNFRNFWERKNENFYFFKNWICGFGGVLGPKSPFFQNFRKLQKHLSTSHTFTIFIR